MSEYDSDIEFDFFDDQETGESAPSESRQRPQQRPPGGQPPRRERPGGIPPTVRLIGLIVFGILIVVLLVLWVQSCSGTSKKSSYQNYLGKVKVLADDSNRLGTTLSQSIAAPGIASDALANKMQSLADQQLADVQIASRLKAPSGLADAQASFVEALQFRVAGLHGLSLALKNGAGSTKVSETATVLAAQSQRLVASDVIYSDKFRAPVLASMGRLKITGVPVAASHFLQDQGVDSQAFWTSVVGRLNNNTTSGSNGGRVGSAITGVVANPGNHVLSTTNQTVVTESTSLEYDVSVQNSGDVQLPALQVTITIIQRGQKSITTTRHTPLINPGQTVVVVFKGLQQPAFATASTLRVDVQTVPHESFTGNNSYSYPVLFSL
ncbi:MAG TPA: hypothetical protein VLJ76_03405 [Gaiellaceae bacterium]|nr:hypothetical protein [Gaiellaceae bacterium]